MCFVEVGEAEKEEEDALCALLMWMDRKRRRKMKIHVVDEEGKTEALC